METTTKIDKLLFFGITFITISAFMFIINYVNPNIGINFPVLVLSPLLISLFITVMKFGIYQTIKPQKSSKLYFFTAIIWTILASIKWIKYFDKDNFNWIITSIFTLIALINWINYFRNSKK